MNFNRLFVTKRLNAHSKLAKKIRRSKQKSIVSWLSFFDLNLIYLLELGLTGTYELAIGIGFGDFQVIHLGGVLKRIEYFVAEEALQRALYALRATTKEKPVAVSTDVWKLIED